MRRVSLLRSWVMLSVVLVSAGVSADVWAKPDRKSKRGRKLEDSSRPAPTPESNAIAPLLGALRWGLTKRQVMRQLEAQIEERYRTQAAGQRDTLEEDRVFQQMREEIRRVRKSFVVFRGQHTGWEGTFLRDEFRHGSGEAMFSAHDEHTKSYYFFINDRLWKWYRQFSDPNMNDQAYDAFAAAVERKFGRAAHMQRELPTTKLTEHWLQWQDGKTRLRAVRRGGHYALIFESRQTLERLESLRAKAHRRHTSDYHHIVHSALLKDHDKHPHERQEARDNHEDAADAVLRSLRARNKRSRSKARSATRR